LTTIGLGPAALFEGDDLPAKSPIPADAMVAPPSFF